jgi:hypothetical protein
VPFSAVAIPEITLNLFQKYFKVFLLQKPILLPPLQEVNYIITLLNTKMESNLQIFTVSDKYMLKYEQVITK